MAKGKTKGITAVLLLLLLAIVGVFGYLVYRNLSDDINGRNQPDKEYLLIVEKQDFAFEIGKKLKANGIIVNDTLWTNWMANRYPDFQYINGEYQMRADMSYEEIAQKLQHPDVSHKTVKVVIPEGYNVFEIAATMEENGICKKEDFLRECRSKEGYDYAFLASVPQGLNAYQLEGFLFPATYDIGLNTEARDVVNMMLRAFDERYNDSMDRFCEEHGMTLFELMTLVSVVQEEAFTNESAANIASVFMNRLEKGSKLQSDVTYFYARTLRDDYGFSQEVYDAYYTYRCDGLPAGPITNAGEAVIKATVNYPATDYLYFFSDLNKEFHYASTYEEFLKLQEKYPWKE